MPRCKAKSKQSGQPCGNWAMRGREVCQFHGGKSLRGLASPTFKHGRLSKDVPTRILARYQESLRDPHLLEMRDEIALIDSRIGDVLTRVDSGEAGALWAALRATHKDFKRARARGDVAAMDAALSQLEEDIERGYRDHAAWAEVVGLVDNRRKLVEGEHKRLVAMQQMISAEKAMVLIAQIIDSIGRHVEDRNQLNGIILDIDRFITRESVGRIAEFGSGEGDGEQDQP